MKHIILTGAIFSLRLLYCLCSLTSAAPCPGSKDWQGQEEGSSSEQGQVHQQDVPPRGLGHHCPQEPQVSLKTMVPCNARKEPLCYVAVSL
jgi:hypothetical protein